ncbi:MAG: hypothetical protein A2W31_04355 [Planctomycetes bacterium RBG_16_64_10]|nr:MAG: hypothetical protein A2W31_04355 [Planctomycetes bacterium RBG_16_64_10]
MMLPADDSPPYLQPYRWVERRHGADFRTTLWANGASQRRRFEVLAETYALANRRVLDAGAGMGDLLAYLEETRQPPASYVGLDALAEVIGQARRRCFVTPAEFIRGDLLANPDLLKRSDPEVIVISGTLNTFSNEQFYLALDHAFAAASHCLLFNYLSIYNSDRFPTSDGMIQRRDPVRVFQHGLQHTRHIIVRHDYFDGHDCTMAWIKG